MRAGPGEKVWAERTPFLQETSAAQRRTAQNVSPEGGSGVLCLTPFILQVRKPGQGGEETVPGSHSELVVRLDGAYLGLAHRSHREQGKGHSCPLVMSLGGSWLRG